VCLQISAEGEKKLLKKEILLVEIAKEYKHQFETD
jgi:hypothetical protein